MSENYYDDSDDDFIDETEEELSFDGYDRRGWQKLDRDQYDDEDDSDY